MKSKRKISFALVIELAVVGLGLTCMQTRAQGPETPRAQSPAMPAVDGTGRNWCQEARRRLGDGSDDQYLRVMPTIEKDASRHDGGFSTPLLAPRPGRNKGRNKGR